MAPIATDDIPTIEKAEVGHAGKASIPVCVTKIAFYRLFRSTYERNLSLPFPP